MPFASTFTTFALATGLLFNTASGARLSVRHDGPPIDVEIVGLTEDGREVEVTALPSKLRVSRTPRKIFVQYSSEVTALCSASNSKSQQASLRFRSCVSVKPKQTGSSATQGATTGGALGSRLRQALTATPQLQIEHQSQQLPETE